MLNISKDVSQKWNMVENDESMDAPKSVRFHWKYNNYENDAKSSNPWTLQNVSISLGNMKILKISWSNQKSGSPRMLIITDAFKEKWRWGPKTKIRQSKNAYIYCCFWRILMITRVEERWRTSKMWILARTCSKSKIWSETTNPST